jgi:hypothetical protein
MYDPVDVKDSPIKHLCSWALKISARTITKFIAKHGGSDNA